LLYVANIECSASHPVDNAVHLEFTHPPQSLSAANPLQQYTRMQHIPTFSGLSLLQPLANVQDGSIDAVEHGLMASELVDMNSVMIQDVPVIFETSLPTSHQQHG
jgi:hypothetical protein